MTRIKLARYRKFIVALLAAAGVVGAELPPDAPSWLSSVFAVAGALGVLYVRNAPPPPAPTLFARTTRPVRDTEVPRKDAP